MSHEVGWEGLNQDALRLPFNSAREQLRGQDMGMAQYQFVTGKSPIL